MVLINYVSLYFHQQNNNIYIFVCITQEFQHEGNSYSPNANNNLVNRWIMNDTQNVQLPKSFNNKQPTKSIRKNNPNKEP